MSTVGSILLDQQILLESGTNELELLVFRVADYTFGINVAKVREVLTLQPITRLAKAHASVRGVFKLRNRVIPCVSLVDHLQLATNEVEGERTMILTDFNQQQTAFLVDHVERIHRLSWESILNVPPLMTMSHSPLTAVARCGERLVVLLDFEMIIDQVTGFELDARQAPNPYGVPRETKKIIVADDSITVREAMAKTLRTSGYNHVSTFSNGADAWREIQARYNQRRNVEDVADLLVSDVEMPQMDGLHLTKCVKDHPELKKIPVILYSSLVTPDNHKKGKSVGADAQISKPQLQRVVGLADDLIRGVRENVGENPNGSPSSEPAADVRGETQATPLVAPPVAAQIPTPPVAAAAPAATLKAASQGGAAVAVADPPTTNVEFDTVDRQLWRTFMQEMQSHLVRLSDLASAIDDATADAATLQELGRILHSIKGAAMVVPLDTVARATHLLESLLEQVRRTTPPWSPTPFEQYADWLADLCNPTADPRLALARGPELECDLALALTQLAG
jgi:two-component system chemotaxis response regulator CheV